MATDRSAYDRLPQIANLLRRKPMTSAKLAKKLGVSKRTIARDIRILEQLEIGLEATLDRGAELTYRMETWRGRALWE